jgi:uncharacterized membrane protein
MTTSTRAFLLGALTGARSATPLAMLALRHGDRTPPGTWRGWPVFRSPIGRAALVAAALGEFVGDKLPRTPSRIAPGGLVGRAVSGAIVGLAIASEHRGTDIRVQGALVGAVGAVAGSFAGFLARKLVGRVTHLPDPVVAVAEDVVTVVGTARVLDAR